MRAGQKGTAGVGSACGPCDSARGFNLFFVLFFFSCRFHHFGHGCRFPHLKLTSAFSFSVFWDLSPFKDFEKMHLLLVFASSACTVYFLFLCIIHFLEVRGKNTHFKGYIFKLTVVLCVRLLVDFVFNVTSCNQF